VNKPGRPTTIRDVAAEAKVGLQTVSRVLNGGSYVKASTAERIRQAIARLGYEPNEAARMLKGQKARVIGLIVPDLADPFFAICTNAIQQTLAREGYMTLVLSSERSVEFETNELSMMTARNISALLVVPSHPSSAKTLRDLSRSGLPVITIDRTLENTGCAQVTVQNLEGSEEAVRHLIGHGYEQILCLGYDSEFSSIGGRIEGYKRAMRAAGLKAEVLTPGNGDEISFLLSQRLSRGQRPRAIFCLNNVTMISAIRVLQQLKISVPETVALLGFDDFDLASLLRVSVTTVRQPIAELGHRAAQLALQWIRAGEPGTKWKNTKLVLPTELILRRSCGCHTGE
jgi:LacI family transcriptional regulator